MERFYTVDEVASKLKLHPRTIRRRIGNGEIQAVRVGKQYRIGQKQMDILFGTEGEGVPGNRVSVSSVIEIENVSVHQSVEINSKITAIFLSGAFNGSIHCSYNTELKKLKIFIDCNIEMASEVLSVVKVHIHSILGEFSNGKDI